jgi:predicted small lipoprotein YifL
MCSKAPTGSCSVSVSGRQGNPSSAAALGFLALLVLAPIWTGCGRKEPPKPPPSKVPAQITDLSAQQRGMEFILRMTYPSVTMGGLPLTEIQAIEVWRMSRSVDPFGEVATILDEDAISEEEGTDAGAEEAAAAEMEAEEPPTPPQPSLFQLPAELSAEEVAPEQQVQVETQEFAALARLVRSVSDDELSFAVMGDQLVLRVPIAALPEQDEVDLFAVRTLAPPKLTSPYSNLVKLMPRQPPPPPKGIAVTATATGVDVVWEDLEEDLELRVYRRDAGVRDYGPPIGFLSADETSYSDRSALYGNRYVYTVTSVSSRIPLIESAIGSEHEVDYQDVFAPAAPENLVVLAESGRVRLLWELVVGDDVLGYRVYRQETGEEFRLLTDEEVSGTEYLDRDVLPSRTYSYYITAVDRADNESEASEIALATVP